MSQRLRWILLIANGAAAFGVLLFCGHRADALPEALALPITVEQQWVAGVLVLYVLNAAAAWRFRDSYAVSAARMLLFAGAAFLSVSHGVDLVGENRALLPNLFGADTAAEQLPFVLQLQARLAATAAILTLSLTAIAVGFEASDSA